MDNQDAVIEELESLSLSAKAAGETYKGALIVAADKLQVSKAALRRIVAARATDSTQTLRQELDDLCRLMTPDADE